MSELEIIFKTLDFLKINDSLVTFQKNNDFLISQQHLLLTSGYNVQARFDYAGGCTARLYK